MRNLALLLLIVLAGCQSSGRTDRLHPGPGCRYASYFGIIVSPDDSLQVRGVISVSPVDGIQDTLVLKSPLKNIVCMSSSSVAALCAVGADSVIAGVSGLDYLSEPIVHKRAEDGDVHDVGYENALDYEMLMRMAPDLVVTYTVGESEPPYLTRLRTLGLPVFVIYDHLEEHPLARAEYVRLFGALTGRLDKADTFFENVSDRYISLCSGTDEAPVRVLMNIPYADSWYIPGRDSYMSRLINDAGGLVLGAEKGSASERITIEDAFRLSQQADLWLCPGYCRTREQLEAIHHLFPHFGPIARKQPIYNNIRKVNAYGGNDFWESGAIRPDLILEDLSVIFSSFRKGISDEPKSYMYYFVEL